jgi:hypothetical protein
MRRLLIRVFLWSLLTVPIAAVGGAAIELRLATAGDAPLRGVLAIQSFFFGAGIGLFAGVVAAPHQYGV